MHGDGGVRARGREDETFHKNENRTYECARRYVAQLFYDLSESRKLSRAEIL